MGRSMVFYYPPSSTTALMAAQDVDSSLVLNANTIPSKTWNISIISTANAAGHTFTIAGTDIDGSALSATITGGAANVAATTVSQFKSVTSIISKTAGVPAAVNNVKAGVMDLIAATQEVALGDDLVLRTGDNAVITFSGATAYILSLTSSQDMSGVNFTITGTDAGNAPLVEIVGGPNANTVFSLGAFHTISSISADAIAAEIKVGTEVYLASLQNTGANGVFTLVNTTFPGQDWTLSLSSANDLSGATFDITGTNLAGASTELRVGPNNDYVETVNEYSTVSSVEVNASVDDITINIPNYIMPLQDIDGADAAVLSQNVVKFPLGTAYLISLKSANNLSAVTFAIVGTDINGGAQNEDVTGPNNETVVTVNTYNSITSITPDINAAGVSAGAQGFIAAAQDVVADVPANIPLDNGFPVVFDKLARPITFTSVPNNSGITLTITGTDIWGNTATEVITGPNNSTVTSVNKYHTVISIVPSGEFFELSAGTGTTGIFYWAYLDKAANPFNLTIAGIVSGTINYSVNQTQDSQGSYVNAGSTFYYSHPITSPFLANNPLEFTNASGVIVVTVPSTQGLQTGQLVTISGVSGTIHNITAAQLNVRAPIIVLSPTTFSYQTAGTSNANDAGAGGANITYTTPPFPATQAITAALTGATTSQIFNMTTVADAVQGTITSSTGGSLTLTLTQAGY